MLKHKLAHLLLALTIGHGVPKKYAIPLFIAGQFDAVTTYRLDKPGGLGHEDNPLLRPFSSNISVYPAMLVGDSTYLAIDSHFLASHHKLLWLSVGAEIALHIYCGVHNINVYQQTHRFTGYASYQYPRMDTSSVRRMELSPTPSPR